MLLIPSIDLRGGHSVRLFKGDFSKETRYDLAPHELLARYAALGASWLHVVDLDGARAGKLANRSIIVALASQRALRIQVGGGVRSDALMDDLLRVGVDRVVIGSAAVEQPELTAGWLRRHGGEKICIALDVKHDPNDQPLVYTRGWTQGTALSLWDAVAKYQAFGLKHVLCTDIERDGALAGPSLKLYAEAQRRFPSIQWQASGGVRDAADLAALANIGCAAAISGKALLEERMTAAELAPYLRPQSGPASQDKH
jgi:phosphoribosylformimino-5-aminoimidazole carboxamide ribotide isomerase